MRPVIIAILMVTFLARSNAQQVINTKVSCSYYGKLEDTTHYTYAPSKRMENYIKEIMDASNLNVPIIVKESDVENAQAVLNGDQRYILYNPEFIDHFEKSGRTKWAAYAVLAHEVAHHLSWHLLANADSSGRHRMELEADLFSGAILRALGATLFEAQSGLSNYLNYKPSNSHPSKHDRLDAIAAGWMKQDQRLSVQFNLRNVRPTFESFKQYVESLRRFHDFEEFVFNILPTQEDCEQLFSSSEDAKKYYGLIQTLKTNEREFSGKIIAAFEFAPFTTNDIRNNSGNYPGGFEKILPKLKGERVFYTVRIKENGKELGMAYNSFTVVGDHWVFFFKPWRAFND